jgi:hypothetical protein
VWGLFCVGLFVIFGFFRSSPPLTVFCPDLVYKELDAITRYYLQTNIKYQDGIFKIPHLFELYERDFIPEFGIDKNDQRNFFISK